MCSFTAGSNAHATRWKNVFFFFFFGFVYGFCTVFLGFFSRVFVLLFVFFALLKELLGIMSLFFSRLLEGKSKFRLARWSFFFCFCLVEFCLVCFVWGPVGWGFPGFAHLLAGQRGRARFCGLLPEGFL